MLLETLNSQDLDKIKMREEEEIKPLFPKP